MADKYDMLIDADLNGSSQNSSKAAADDKYDAMIDSVVGSGLGSTLSTMVGQIYNLGVTQKIPPVIGVSLQDAANAGKASGQGIDALTAKTENLGSVAGPAIGVPLQMARQLVPETPAQVALLGAGGPIESGLKSVGGALTRELTPAMRSIAQIAEEKGLPLTLADVTKSKLWSGLESFLEKTPLGTKPFQEFKNTQIQILKDARDELLKKFGPSQEAFNLGESIKNSVIERSQSFYDASKKLYDKVGEAAAALGADNNIPLNNLRAKAEQLLAREQNMAPALQDKGLIEELKSLTSEGLPKKISNTSPLLDASGKPIVNETVVPTVNDFQYAQNVRSRLGELIAQEDGAVALKSGGGQSGLQGAKFQSTPAGGAYKALRGALNDDVKVWANGVGGDVKDTADVASAFYKEGKQTFDNSIIRSVAKRNPESVADFLLTPNAVSEVQAIKKSVSPETFNQIRQSFVEKVLKSMTKGSEVGNEVFLPNNINNALAKYGQPMMKELFSAGELSELTKIGQLSSTIGSAERLAGNASGTARQLISGATGGLILHNPVAGISTLIGPPIIAKMYLSQTGRRLLIDGLRMSAESRQAVSLGAAITSFITQKQYQDSKKDNPGLRPTPQEVSDNGMGALERAFKLAGIK